MSIEHDYDGVTFSSGRKCYANNGIIGLNHEGEVYEGYDGGFGPSSHSAERLTSDERKELAAHMIALWTAFGEAVTP